MLARLNSPLFPVNPVGVVSVDLSRLGLGIPNGDDAEADDAVGEIQDLLHALLPLRPWMDTTPNCA